MLIANKLLDARGGIGQVWALSAVFKPHPQRLRHQRHTASCASNIPVIKDFRRFVKFRHYALINHPLLSNYSVKTRSLALSLALQIALQIAQSVGFKTTAPITLLASKRRCASAASLKGRTNETWERSSPATTCSTRKSIASLIKSGLAK
jgi:hypothetical protein